MAEKESMTTGAKHLSIYTTNGNRMSVGITDGISCATGLSVVDCDDSGAAVYHL